MKTIWKMCFPLMPSTVRHNVMLPEGAKPLHLETQYHVPTMWFEVDTEADAQRRVFEWVGTGRPIPDGGEYVATVLLHGDTLVLHLYEVPV